MDLIGISRITSRHASTRIKPADRHGMEWASAGRLLPEWRNGNLQYPRRVSKGGWFLVFHYRIGVVQFTGFEAPAHLALMDISLAKADRVTRRNAH